MTEEEKRNVISSLDIGQVFEGIGNIINIVGKVIGESSTTREKKTGNEKSPVGSHK